MDRNGKPYIPPRPLCPTERGVGEFTVAPEMFEFVVADGVTDGTSSDLLTDIGGLFCTSDGFEDDEYVATGMVEVPHESRLAEMGRAIATSSRRAAIELEAGKIFYERIKQCHGVIDGECWALGKRAVVAVIEQLTSGTEL